MLAQNAAALLSTLVRFEAADWNARVVVRKAGLGSAHYPSRVEQRRLLDNEEARTPVATEAELNRGTCEWRARLATMAD